MIHSGEKSWLDAMSSIGPKFVGSASTITLVTPASLSCETRVGIEALVLVGSSELYPTAFVTVAPFCLSNFSNWAMSTLSCAYTTPNERVLDVSDLSPANSAFLPESERPTNAAVSGTVAVWSEP